jgi:hypothetical protein
MDKEWNVEEAADEMILADDGLGIEYTVKREGIIKALQKAYDRGYKEGQEDADWSSCDL